MQKNVLSLCINKTTSLGKALRTMDEIGHKLLIVVDQNKFHGLLSIGDIQRAIIQYNNLEIEVQSVLRKTIKVAFETDDMSNINRQIKLSASVDNKPIHNIFNDGFVSNRYQRFRNYIC